MKEQSKSLNYLSQKIASPEILSKLATVRGTEVWNATYSEAIEELNKRGYFVVAEPSETHATIDGLEWYSRVYEIHKSSSGKCSVYAYDSLSSFSSWRDAVESAVMSALDECIEKNRRTEQKDQVKSEKDQGKPDKETTEEKRTERHKYGKMFGCHSDEDPYPYE